MKLQSMKLSGLPSVTDALRLQELREQADADLCARLLKGIYTYLVMVGVLAVATKSFQQHRSLMWSTTAVLSVGLAARLGLIVGRKPLYRANPSRWRAVLGITIVLIAGSCGYLHAALAIQYSIESWPFLISAIWIAGLTAGGCLTFVPSMAFVNQTFAIAILKKMGHQATPAVNGTEALSKWMRRLPKSTATNFFRFCMLKMLWLGGFYPGCHRVEPYRSQLRQAESFFPVTESLTNRALVLPTGTAVTTDVVDRIYEIIRLVVRENIGEELLHHTVSHLP